MGKSENLTRMEIINYIKIFFLNQFYKIIILIIINSNKFNNLYFNIDFVNVLHFRAKTNRRFLLTAAQIVPRPIRWTLDGTGGRTAKRNGTIRRT